MTTKTTSQHTPGPWKVERLPGRDAILMSGPHIVARCERKGIESYSSGFADAAVEANARLIAAAPEMLDAIKRTLRTLENMTSEEFRGGADRPLRQSLNALLAKIEGGS